MGDLVSVSTAPEDNTAASNQPTIPVQPVVTQPAVRPQPQAGETSRSQLPLQHPQPSQNAFSGQLEYLPQYSAMARQGNFNMAPIAMNLPQPDYRPQHFHPGYTRYDQPGPPVMMHPMQQAPTFSGQPVSSMHTGGYYAQMPSYYSPEHMQTSPGPPPMYHQQGMAYYNQMPMSPQSPSYYGHNQQQRHPKHIQPALAKGIASQKPGGNQGFRHNAGRNQKSSKEAKLATGKDKNSRYQHNQGSINASALADSTAQQPVIRGPARKPRQSGHAVWIGNLPPQTDIMALVHFVCKETSGLESLFLISKSNCAFANFKDEEACHESQQKLHDAKFQSVRLVCRLRKGSVDDTVTQTNDSTTSAQDIVDKATITDEEPSTTGPVSTEAVPSPMEARKDRYFILKSLTTEDLDLSVSTGVWATQSHNEELLSAAFKSADSVYLIFSANKSGEYYGYARMSSPINQDPSAAIKFAPQIQPAGDLDGPQAVLTEPTDDTPAGRIVDDSARGTIFWEIDSDESDEELDESLTPDNQEGEDDAVAEKTGAAEEQMQTVGKPFRLEWLSNDRLPFFRTRGLRNPWNSNREVKIARDGTELEPSVGKRLISLFNSTPKPTHHPLQPKIPPGFVPGFS